MSSHRDKAQAQNPLESWTEENAERDGERRIVKVWKVPDSIQGDLAAFATLNLTYVTYLSLNSCTKLKGDISMLARLTLLVHLDLGNDLGNGGAFLMNFTGNLTALANLKQLTYLSLNSCRELKGDISVLAGLTLLVHLDLGGSSYRMNFTGNVAALANLTRLQKLCLRNCCKLEGNVTALANLTRLQEVNLHGCRNLLEDKPALALFVEAAAYFPDFKPHASYFGVFFKNLATELRLPQELAEANNTDILAFLRERSSQGSVSFSIAKVLVTGPGSAGKTCLIHTLATGRYPDEEPGMTNGMDVQRVEESDVELLFYDFGGQPVYASSHQLFLRSRAVFVVAWDPRIDAEPPHAYVRDVLDANPGAHILFVTTKADEGHAPPAAGLRGLLQDKYPANFKGLHQVSAKRGDNLKKLVAALVTEARTLPFMDQELPASYQTLRQRVEQLQADKSRFHLTAAEFRAEATTAGVPEDGVAMVRMLFHSWGLVLQLPGNPEASPLVLRPKDLADVLSEVVTMQADKMRNCQNGLLRHRDIGRVWRAFDKALHPYFLQLIHDYDLGIPIHVASGQGIETEDLQATLIPAMLQVPPPIHTCTHIHAVCMYGFEGVRRDLHNFPFLTPPAPNSRVCSPPRR